VTIYRTAMLPFLHGMRPQPARGQPPSLGHQPSLLSGVQPKRRVPESRDRL